MCGIVGIIGHQNAKEILLKGLEKLEYRGYDSAGIAIQTEEGVVVFKEKGRIARLRSNCRYCRTWCRNGKETARYNRSICISGAAIRDWSCRHHEQ